MSQQMERVRRKLRIVQWAAWIDLILLVALIASSLSKQRDFVHVLGPLHGINFLLLVVIVATAALDGLWGWWFPVAILLTGGAPGALVGEWIIKRGIASQIGSRDSGDVSPGEQIETENMLLVPDIANAKRSTLDERKVQA